MFVGSSASVFFLLRYKIWSETMNCKHYSGSPHYPPETSECMNKKLTSWWLERFNLFYGSDVQSSLFNGMDKFLRAPYRLSFAKNRHEHASIVSFSKAWIRLRCIISVWVRNDKCFIPVSCLEFQKCKIMFCWRSTRTQQVLFNGNHL